MRELSGLRLERSVLLDRMVFAAKQVCILRWGMHGPAVHKIVLQTQLRAAALDRAATRRHM